MLQSLQQIGNGLGRNLARGWEALSEGWRELLSRSASALTPFRRRRDADTPEVLPADAPRWSLLSGDVVDTGTEIVVRVELPGVDKEDCEVLLERHLLRVRGEKRSDTTQVSGDYLMRQCAYGFFERTIPIRKAVDPERARAQFKNGVLLARLPKVRPERRSRIRVL